MSLLTNSDDDIFRDIAIDNDIPSYGWRIPFSHSFNSNFKPMQPPTLSQALRFLIIGLRTLFYIIYEALRGRRAVMNPFMPVPLKPIYGCPIGGIGCGTIGRGYRGQFTRFCIVPGLYEHNTVKADQFIVTIRRHGKTTFQSVLSAEESPSKLLSSWKYNIGNAFYTALYPRSWTYYDIPEEQIVLICQQVSPVIPHNYKDSSLPVCAFIWRVKNYGSEEADISITFCFKNGTSDYDPSSCWTETKVDSRVCTIAIHHRVIKNYECSYAISTTSDSKTSITGLEAFNPCGDGSEVWTLLRDSGRLDSLANNSSSLPRSEVGIALANQITVQAGDAGEIVFTLNWAMPVFTFRGGSVVYSRRYTEWFGEGRECAFLIGEYALNNYGRWISDIQDWQSPILQSALPNWYKSVLFNELYYVSDGGSVWVRIGQSSADSINMHMCAYGRFGYLEGHEYRMYNTYDVHAYASYAFISLWPHLQISMQYDYAKYIRGRVPHTRFYLNCSFHPIKTFGTMPHDLGNPEGEPWVNINAYNAFPTDLWKDLNSLFVIISYRDYHVTQNKEYLMNVLPAINTVMERQLGYTDHTGLILSSDSIPDNTFDTLIAHGHSVYLNTLWVSALWCYIQILKITSESDRIARFTDIFSEARKQFAEILFNGDYFDYCSRGHNSRCVFAGQLVGHWLLKTVNVPDDEVFQRNQVHKAMDKIVKLNVETFGDYEWGAVNGMLPDGRLDRDSPQSDEIWIGVTCSLTSLFILENQPDLGMSIMKGMYKRIYEDIGMMFQTPEALVKKGYFRSLGYMRGLTIWAVQFAFDSIKD